MSAEGDIKRAILAALARLGIEAWRTHSGQVRVKRGYMHCAPVGTPDIIGYLKDGRLLGIEVKDPKGKTEKSRAAAQAQWRQEAARHGCVVGVAHSVEEAVRIVMGGSVK